MAFHIERIAHSKLKSKPAVFADPCHDPHHRHQHRRQARLQRYLFVLMAVNILIIGLVSAIVFTNLYEDDLSFKKIVGKSFPNLGLAIFPGGPLPPPKQDLAEINAENLTFGDLTHRSLSLAEQEQALTELYEMTEAAVVKIITVQRGMVDRTRTEPRGDASGSGIIFDLEGHIVTNNHVVAGATDVVVQLGQGRVVRATLLGQDPTTDLAVLQIEVPPQELAAVPFADSNALRVGQVAIAIGYPFGLDKSLTVGHISGLDRMRPSGDKFIPTAEGMIQTDAAINPGNSGGPLFNLQGEVVGINTAIFSTSRGSQGIGFAVPSNLVQQVTAQLLDKGFVSRPFLGVFGLPLNAKVAGILELDVDQGLLVQEVSGQSAAWAAGLRPGERWGVVRGFPIRLDGDVLIAIDGQAVDSMETLSALVQKHSIGDTVTLTVHRAGEEIELEVVLNERPASIP